MPFMNDFKRRTAGGPYYDMGNSFYLDDKEELHRDGDLPAWITENGDKGWFQHGQCHREGKPAIERADGGWEYFENGERHRDMAPAVHYGDGSKPDEYWERGRQLTEEQVRDKFAAAAAKTDRAIGAAVVQQLDAGLKTAVKPLKTPKFAKNQR